MLRQLKINGHLGTSLLTTLILGMIVSLAQASIGFETVDGPPPRKFAVLIAIDHYPDEQIPPLNYCKSDTLALKETLITGGFREENIFLMTDDAKRINLLPTKENIRRILATLEELANDGDMIFFFFSGHSGSSQENGVYLLTVDSTTKDQLNSLNVSEEPQFDSPTFTEHLLRGLQERANEDELTVDSEIKDKRRFLVAVSEETQHVLPTEEDAQKFAELIKRKDDDVIIHWHVHDTRVSDDVSVQMTMESNRLNVQEILDTLGRSKAKFRIIAIDSCLDKRQDILTLPKNTALLLAAKTGFLSLGVAAILGNGFVVLGKAGGFVLVPERIPAAGFYQ